jgi:decaprenylphosphoryl-5-phosphoribose phosphatase
MSPFEGARQERRRPASIDERLLRFARTRGHTPAAERAVARFSKLGEHGAVWVAMGIAGSLAAQPGRRRSWMHADATRACPRSWMRATATVAATYGANTLIKFAVRRRRPDLPGLPPLAGTPTRLSFPSAHSSTSFAAALAYRRLGAPAAPLYGLAGGLALSRLYLGLHYPSDVLAGALFGSALAAAWAPRPA